jgi:hypothetical protein
MITLKEMQNKIKDSLLLFLLESGFTFHNLAFYHHTTDLIKVIQLQHLSPNLARYFGTNTATFSIRLGIFYNFIPIEHKVTKNKEVFLPKEYECHIRRTLLRDFEQEVKRKELDNAEEDKIKNTRKWLFNTHQ